MKDDESRFEFEVDRHLVGAIAGLFLGVVLVYAGVGGFFELAEWEADGGSYRMPMILIPIYRLTGKWGIGLLLGLPGLLLVYTGFYYFAQRLLPRRKS